MPFPIKTIDHIIKEFLVVTNKPSADIGLVCSVHTCTVISVSDAAVNSTTNRMEPTDSVAVLELR